MKRRCIVVLVSLACTLAGTLTAEVHQQLNYDYYSVTPRSGETLQEAVSRSSPIHEAGNIFHGYTRWRVSWEYEVASTGNRQCRLENLDIEVTGTIQLPKLSGGTDAMRRRFNTYLDALHRHELGHFAFAQQAAEEIDRELKWVEQATDCRALRTRVNDTAYRILNRYQQQEDAYDRETDHGRTQGAWLGGE